MDEFFNKVAARLQHESGPSGQPRVGVVTSSDPSTSTAKILLQPEGVLTGWLPVLTQWVGSGWGLVCPPSPGDQVLVIPQEGNAQHGIIVGRLYSNSVRPPSAELGEIALCHESGCSIRLLNAGVVSINGDLHVQGDIYDRYGSLNSLRGHYDIHIHQTSNGSQTSKPAPLD